MVVGVGVGPGVRIIGRVVFVVVGARFGSVTGAKVGGVGLGAKVGWAIGGKVSGGGR